ncbi:MAG: hypothetical protein IJM88_02010 [Bacteroidales bacterium]|nr:hypothetical protein [Bacteroidales bacterium]
MAHDEPWERIFSYTGMDCHDFSQSPYVLTAEQIKNACRGYKRTGDREVRILCKQDTRESRPQAFKERGLFILPKNNGVYYIVKGEGYVDIPDIVSPIEDYHRKLDFDLLSSQVGDSEMQHLDYAYANSLVRTFVGDDSLVLSIRGRKRAPLFNCRVSGFPLEIAGVQTEVDAGYEGRNCIVLIEAKNSRATNTIIRQLYFPYCQWKQHTGKKVLPLFFEKKIVNGSTVYYIWQFDFKDEEDYNSIYLVKSARYRIMA